MAARRRGGRDRGSGNRCRRVVKMAGGLRSMVYHPRSGEPRGAVRRGVRLREAPPPPLPMVRHRGKARATHHTESDDERGSGIETIRALGSRLEKEYRFPDFRQALAFVNRVGEIAEEEGHHPDFELGWGRVKLALWTHSIGGLSENDCILAAKADRALAAAS